MKETKSGSYGKYFAELADCITHAGAYKATKYISEKLTIKATRKRYKKKLVEQLVEIMFTMGCPNYEERQFIKKMKKTKMPFPHKGLVIKFPK